MEPEQTNIPSEPKQEEGKKNSKNLLLIPLFIILAIATVGGSYYYGTKKAAVPTPTASTKPTVTPQLASETPTTNSFASKTPTFKPTSTPIATATAATTTPTSKPSATPDNRADLYVSNYTFNHEPVTGEPFTVSVKISNNGGTASGDFIWEWWADTTSPTYVCRAPVLNIVAHSDRVVTCTYTYSKWLESGYKSMAIVDVDNTVNESNETNNTFSRNIQVIQ